MEKKSFVLHADLLEQIGDLSDKDLGQLFRAILCHENGQPLPPTSADVSRCLRFIFADLERNARKYKEMCERNKLNAAKRYRRPDPGTEFDTGNGNNGTVTVYGGNRSHAVASSGKRPAAQFNQFHQREYDYEALQKSLLDKQLGRQGGGS